MSAPYELKTDRRTTLKWLAAAVAGSPLLAACGAADQTTGQAPLLGAPRAISGQTYGADPDLMDPQVTWDLTMTGPQLQLVAALTDMVLPEHDGVPAGSALGIPDFINEWVSSPYELTQTDRTSLFALFEWLEGEARSVGVGSFAAATSDQKRTLLDRIAWKDRIEAGAEDQARAFDRFRNLTVSAYFASEPGTQWLGYIGNQPALGDYAGPTQEALDHLADALGPLGLTMPEGL